MDTAIVIILLFLGVIFFISELFFIQGFSLAGFAGALLMVGSIYYAYANIGSAVGLTVLLVSVLISGISLWVFLRSKISERIASKKENAKKNNSLGANEIGERRIA